MKNLLIVLTLLVSTSAIRAQLPKAPNRWVQSYNSFTQNWDTTCLDWLYYDGNGDLIEVDRKARSQNGSWLNINKYVYTRDVNGDILRELLLIWNDTVQTWDSVSKKESTFYSRGKPATEKWSLYKAGTWTWYQVDSTFYDSNHRKISDNRTEFYGPPPFLAEGRGIYLRDGNDSISTYYHFYKNRTTLGWDTFYREDYIYDLLSKTDTIITTYQDTSQMWHENYNKEYRHYNLNDKIVVYERRRCDPNGCNGDIRTTYTYLADGRPETEMFEQQYNQNEVYVKMSRYLYSYEPVNTGLELSGMNRTVRVYPNPARNMFTIDITGYTEDFDVQLLDLQGRVLQQWTANQTTPLKLNTHIMPGTYALKILLAGQVKTKRLVIE